VQPTRKDVTRAEAMFKRLVRPSSRKDLLAIDPTLVVERI
jgi:hypothetical protein